MSPGSCLMDGEGSCENVAVTGLKLGGEQFWVWELLAHRFRAEGTLWGGAAISELFHRDFSGENHKVTQRQADMGNCHCFLCFSASDFSILVPALVTFSQMFPPTNLHLREYVKRLDRITCMTINLPGLSYPHRKRNF